MQLKNRCNLLMLLFFLCAVSLPTGCTTSGDTSGDTNGTTNGDANGTTNGDANGTTNGDTSYTITCDGSMKIVSPSAGQREVVCGLAFRFIPAGTFVMGSPSEELGRDDEEIQHEVTLTKDFWMKETEVTQAEWQSVMGNNPSTFSFCGSNCPVESVSWEDAVQFCNALSMQQGLTECYTLSSCNSTPESTCISVGQNLSCTGYRLPTEAEWEYAYRAGTTTAFYSGKITDLICKDTRLASIGWYCANSANGGSNTAKTMHPVGTKAANEWGLYDMSGNVWEWCWDIGGKYSTEPQIDPQGNPQTTEYSILESGEWLRRSRMLRGGSWESWAVDCRAANRNLGKRGSDTVGLRLVRFY